MARIFISHSSRDNDAADLMKAWLASQGFENAFLDKDPTTGIPPGAGWEKTLYQALEQSQAVIILQTPNWLASKWCFAEFTQARALGKAIFPLIEEPTGGARISPDIQTLDLTNDRAAALGRLYRELVRIALDAQGGFVWDASRPPFPGLLYFEEADAAVYFGRDDDIRRVIERLEARRANGGAKLIVLLGWSGSGKSSLLRAGVIPRLKRAGRNWIVVPPIRPDRRPVVELAQALAKAAGRPEEWRKLQGDLLGPDPTRALDDLGNDLRANADAGGAPILIPIDQGEELFGVADPDEAQRFFEILSHATSGNLPFLAVMALRSDYLGQLQCAKSLTARFEESSLATVPLARIPDIIQGPARVAGLGVEEAFVHQATFDAETEDTLPLLAFALRELLDRSPEKFLSFNSYKALGDEKAGLTPLENAVRKAADEVLADANPAADELTALREAFVPAMVRINDQGEYVRRPARLDELPPKSRPLLELLARRRLLTIGQNEIEVAHEALLRKWPRLRSWLDAEREFLLGKQQLEQDVCDWEQAADRDKVGTLLTGLKLNRARAWLLEHPTQLSEKERGFIQASIRRDEAQARTWRNITWGAIAATLVFAIVAVWALFEDHKAQELANEAVAAQQRERAARKIADENAQQALAAGENATKNEARAVELEKQAKAEQKVSSENASRALTGLSLAASLQGHHTDALKLALASWPRSPADQRPELSRTVDALARALEGPLEVTPPLRHERSVDSGAFSHDGKRVITGSDDKTARIWDAGTGLPIDKPLQHDGTVNSVAFTLDGTRVVTASADDTARVWNVATGAPIGKPLRHDGTVLSAAFSPDGKRVVTASEDSTARVWDAATGAPIGEPLRHLGFVSSAAFSPDGARVVTASEDSTARIWDAATGAPIGKPLQHKGGVSSAVFSPDGKRVVTASFDNTARVWDAATGAPIGKPLKHGNTVRSAAFSPDGARVVTASFDNTARVWDVATGAPIGEPLRHEEGVNSAAFSPDGARVVTASDDSTARVWDAATGAQIGEPLRHDGPVEGAAFSPDGARVVTASFDNTARVWNSATGAPIGQPSRHDGPVEGAAFSLDGARVVTASFDNTARIWDAATGAPIGKPLQHKGGVSSAAFSPDGAQVVTASFDKTARLWDAATGAPIGKPLQHEEGVKSAAFSPDGARVVTASFDKTARLWDAATGAPIGKPLQHGNAVLSAAFSPDGKRVVTASDDKTARVWDAATGAPIGEPLRHEEGVNSAAFSPDGARVVTASDDKTARLWDAATGAPIGKPLQHGNAVLSAAFSPDGKRVVTASEDSTARVWDAATGAPIGEPLRHDSTVFSAAFSPDGARVVTASADKTARLWDAATGAPIGQPLRHEGGVSSAAFSPDGKRVVTASDDGTARVWRAPPIAPNFVATACEMLGSNHDTAGLFARYGIDVKDAICTGEEPAPDPSRMIER